MEVNNILANQYNKVSDINNNLFLQQTNEVEEQDGSGAISFSQALKEQLDVVNNKQIEADIATQKMIQGEDIAIHDVMLAGEEAKVSLQLAMQVRNKLVEAFQEINRTQI
ncbi:flagellar hook-basal body complex protein FliE [uncultured Clostridium sp.]|jgi:flagellar hook-basal body complex protein FliE|uniref:flagellar hook-basal body complex protein FliE n=1 Tax=uncultured Clostridium sp. TaxID=59620 RepID=UPI00262AAA52|nr:flagellar hook-basal body complex protein FliE [uncultured Clostridium sp.]